MRLTGLIFGALLLAQPGMAYARKAEVADLLRVAYVAEPDIAPDGSAVVYTVTIGPTIAFASIVGVQPVISDTDCGHGEPWCASDDFAQAVSAFFSAD